MDGKPIDNYNIVPNAATREIVRHTMATHGAVLVSSMWQGSWAPPGCPTGGSLSTSALRIKNVRVRGTVLKGPEPPQCPPMPPSPVPMPLPAPVPLPVPAHAPVPAPSPAPSQCKIQNNVDCVGKDVFDLPAVSIQDCCNMCSNTTDCKAFTHNMVDGHGSPHCYLKSSCSGAASRSGSNSGTIDKLECSYLDNTDCSGSDLENHAAASLDACCELCKQNSACSAFTHNKNDGHGGPHCYLKSACDNQVSRSGSNSGKVARDVVV